jgi:hypothetical protein
MQKVKKMQAKSPRCFVLPSVQNRGTGIVQGTDKREGKETE